MTARQELATRAEAQNHDIQPSASPSGKEVARRLSCRHVFEVALEADAAAGTAIAQRAEVGIPASQFPNGCEIKEVKFRSAAVTPHADDHFTDTISVADVNGANSTAAATLTSDADVAAGSGGLGAGATTALKEYEALLNATVANRRASAGGVITVTRAKAGNGVQLGRVHYTIVVEAL